MSIGRWIHIKRLQLQEQKEVIRLFYRSPRFVAVDLSFFLLSFFSNPYRTCRQFLQSKNHSSPYSYGETSYRMYEAMAQQVELTEKDCWLELGSGRGKGCFWLSCFFSCRVIGVDWVPSFVFWSRLFQKCFRFRRLEFMRMDLQNAPFAQASIVYLYGIFLTNQEIQGLQEKLRELPCGARVISVSFPLEVQGFVVKKTFPLSFLWGETEAFVQEKEE